jgi:hypothetical protein
MCTLTATEQDSDIVHNTGFCRGMFGFLKTLAHIKGFVNSRSRTASAAWGNS